MNQIFAFFLFCADYYLSDVNAKRCSGTFVFTQNIKTQKSSTALCEKSFFIFLCNSIVLDIRIPTFTKRVFT